MSKPIPPSRPRGGQECPVCGTTTYSAGGIHPQCAAKKSDQITLEEIKKNTKAKPAADNKNIARWQKVCPGCKALVHVRLKECKCGKKL